MSDAENPDCWEQLESCVRDPKERQKYYVSAAFRMDMETYKKHGTRFCRRCGWRSDLSVYCGGCSECEQCRYPNDRCQCDNPRLQQHMRDLLEERKSRQEQENQRYWAQDR